MKISVPKKEKEIGKCLNVVDDAVEETKLTCSSSWRERERWVNAAKEECACVRGWESPGQQSNNQHQR